MIRYAIINSTGVVVGDGNAPTFLDALSAASGMGQAVKLRADQRPMPGRSYMLGDEFFPLPEKPGEWAEWTGTAWADPRTQAEIDAAAAAALHARRAVASLSKLEFAKRVSHPETGVIQPSSGMALLAGNVPPELDGMVNALPPADQFTLIMELLGANQFDRLNPFVVAAGQYLGMTDAQMDAVFGI